LQISLRVRISGAQPQYFAQFGDGGIHLPGLAKRYSETQVGGALQGSSWIARRNSTTAFSACHEPAKRSQGCNAPPQSPDRIGRRARNAGWPVQAVPIGQG